MHCPRSMHCVFWHCKSQRRKASEEDDEEECENADCDNDDHYDEPLNEEALQFLQADFTTPLYQAFLGINQNDYSESPTRTAASHENVAHPCNPDEEIDDPMLIEDALTVNATAIFRNLALAVLQRKTGWVHRSKIHRLTMIY